MLLLLLRGRRGAARRGAVDVRHTEVCHCPPASRAMSSIAGSRKRGS
jgi:hypothetical protein